jgi:hypothetical protein
MASQVGISARLADYQIAIQSAKGTPATPNTAPFIRCFAAGAPTIQPYIQDARFSMTDGSRDQGDPYVSQIGVRGTLPLYLHPDSIALLWHAALGANGNAGAGDPWTHTATPATVLPYLTIWRTVGGVIFEQFVDCKINTLAVDGQAGAPLLVTIDVLGISSTFGSNEAGLITQVAPYLYMHGAGALKVDTVAYPIHALNLQINNNLNGFQSDGYGIDNVDEQGRDISGSYSIRFSGATAQPLDYRNFFYGSDAGTALTTGFANHALDFKFTHSLANRDMDIAIPVAKWADVPVQPDPGGNVIEVQCAFEAERNWSGGVESNIMTVITRDGQATA